MIQRASAGVSQLIIAQTRERGEINRKTKVPADPLRVTDHPTTLPLIGRLGFRLSMGAPAISIVETNGVLRMNAVNASQKAGFG
jgi:hypothetical protein